MNIWLDKITALYMDYIAKVSELESESSYADGLLGLGKKISDDPCHESFADSLEALLKEFADTAPSPDEVYTILEYICHAPAEYKEPVSAYWMLNAVHGFIIPLTERLSPDNAALLVKNYNEDIPRRQRLPIQKKLYTALIRFTK